MHRGQTWLNLHHPAGSLLLSIVILDLGRVVYYSSAIHNAAREGVLYGAVHNETAQIGRDETGSKGKAVVWQ
jgi:hypothetical protein